MISKKNVTSFEEVANAALVKLGRRETIKGWKEAKVDEYLDRLTNDEFLAGWKIVILSPKIIERHSQDITEHKLVWLDNIGAIRDGHPKRFGVYKAHPAVAKFAGFNSGAGRGNKTKGGYWNTYQFRMPRGDESAALAVIELGKNRSEWLRQFILTGAKAAAQEPYKSADFGRVGKQELCPNVDTVRLTPEQAMLVEGVRRTGERDYKLMQRLFWVGLQVLSNSGLVSPPMPGEDESAKKASEKPRSKKPPKPKKSTKTPSKSAASV